VSRVVSRDPFARTELVRRTVLLPTRGSHPHGRTCAWCGGTSARRRLFCYEVWHDGGRTDAIPGYFCSVGCMRSYHQ